MALTGPSHVCRSGRVPTPCADTKEMCNGGTILDAPTYETQSLTAGIVTHIAVYQIFGSSKACCRCLGRADSPNCKNRCPQRTAADLWHWPPRCTLHPWQADSWRLLSLQWRHQGREQASSFNIEISTNETPPDVHYLIYISFWSRQA